MFFLSVAVVAIYRYYERATFAQDQYRVTEIEGPPQIITAWKDFLHFYAGNLQLFAGFIVEQKSQR